MSISRLFTGVINRSAAAKKAHVIDLSKTHMMELIFQTHT